MTSRARRAIHRHVPTRALAGAATVGLALVLGVAPASARLAALTDPPPTTTTPTDPPTTTTPTDPPPTTTPTDPPPTTTPTDPPPTTTPTDPPPTTTPTDPPPTNTPTDPLLNFPLWDLGSADASPEALPAATAPAATRRLGRVRGVVLAVPNWAAFLPGLVGLLPATGPVTPVAPPTTNTSVPRPPASEQGDRPVAVGQTSLRPADTAGALATMPLALLLALALVAAVAVVVVVARRRGKPARRAVRLGPGTVAVERTDTPADLGRRLATVARGGPFAAVGRDCRGLQLLVQAAAMQGLEVVDPEGYVVRASRRLVEAKGLVSDRRRLPLDWDVVVERPTVAVADGFSVRPTGTADGRMLSFAPGTSLRLWDGDLLR